MTPKIDYKLLGRALEEYEKRGYKYVEVPWVVDDQAIRATLPSPIPYAQIVKSAKPGGECEHIMGGVDALVGSAEQGFLMLDLPIGHYVAATPCFRFEPKYDLLHQHTFMKIELFVRVPVKDDERDRMVGSSVERVMTDAHEVMSLFLPRADISEVQTAEGFDLCCHEIEIGSYGERQIGDCRWVYGTGLALPRYSIAAALSTVL